MHFTILLAFLEFSRTAFSMGSASIVLLLIALWAAKSDVANARGLDKIVALSNLCFAIPLAVFGAEHLSAAQFIQQAVPSFVPWHLFWAYFVGFALLAASLSIATKIQVRWSGLLFGIMMFSFVAMMDIPGVVAHPGNRFNWTLLLRELAFGGGGWLLAAGAMRAQGGDQGRGQGVSILITVGRVLVGIAALFYGVETFLHPLGMPGIPLEKLMSEWIPARPLIGYLTGAILVVAGSGILLNMKTRMAATYLGTWIVLLVVFVYGPILIASPGGSEHCGQSRGAQLLFRHAAVCWSDSRACQRDAAHGLTGAGCDSSAKTKTPSVASARGVSLSSFNTIIGTSKSEVKITRGVSLS